MASIVKKQLVWVKFIMRAPVLVTFLVNATRGDRISSKTLVVVAFLVKAIHGVRISIMVANLWCL